MKKIITAIRGVIVILLAIILFVVGLVGVPASAIALRVTNPQTFEKPLASQEVYQNAQRALHLAVVRMDDPNAQGSIPPSTMERILTSAISYQIYTDTIDAAINGSYDWLTGKTLTPDFTINPLARQANLPAIIADAVVNHVTALLACPEGTDIPGSVDPFTLTCNPGNIDQATVIAQINQSNTASEFARQLSFSGSQIPVTQEITQRAQLVFSILSILPIATFIALVVLTVLMLLVQFNVKKWLRTVGMVIVVFSGVCLLVVLAGFIERTYVINTVLPNTLTTSPALIYYKLGPQQIASSVYSSLLITLLVTSGATLIVGACMLLEAWVMQQKKDYFEAHPRENQKPKSKK